MQIQLGPSLMVGSITATAVYVESLPAPPQLVVARPPPSGGIHGGGRGREDPTVLSMARKVEQIAEINRQRLQVRFASRENDRFSCTVTKHGRRDVDCSALPLQKRRVSLPKIATLSPSPLSIDAVKRGRKRRLVRVTLCCFPHRAVSVAAAAR